MSISVAFGNLICLAVFNYRYLFYMYSHTTATLLLKRWDRCQKVHLMAEESLHDLMPDYCAGI